MSTVQAVVITASAARIGSLVVWERAVLVADRIGLTPIAVWSPAGGTSRALARRGVRFTRNTPDATPFSRLGETPTIVIGPDVVVDRASLIELSAHAQESTAIVVNDAGMPALLFVPASCLTLIRGCHSIAAAVERLRVAGTLRELTLHHFCRRVTGPSAARRLERDLIRHLNGGTHESFFTKVIRRFSVPLSVRLARLDVRPTLVTLAGFAAALLSAWCISQGRYLESLAGALLYYLSMIFDCADGEVARVSMRDSDFGAWFETVVDYSTYVLLLAAVTVAVRGDAGHIAFGMAALVAAGGSLVVAVLATYLRRRVASADPGRFDETSAAALERAGTLQRFASWGRQWIKRSTIAHVVVALALVNQLKVLLFLWAFGATLGSIVIVAVTPFLVRRVAVTRLTVRDIRAQ